MDIIIQPGKLSGTIEVIPSKSQAHRLLICAAFADRPTTLLCPETNRDIEATADCLNALGAQITRTDTGYQEKLLCEITKNINECGKIVTALEELRDRIVLYACIDTLEYLYKGGRISQTVYRLGSLAQVKPIIRVSPEGAVEVPGKAIGLRKGMDMLCKRLEAQKPAQDFPLYVMYTADRTNAETLAEKFRELGFEIPPERIIPVGAAIGSHIGPNGCGMVYVSE